MSDELWRQWQAFLGLLGQPGGPGPASGFASAQAGAFAPHIPSAEAFTAAAHKYLEAVAKGPGPGAAEAVRAFGDFLREQSADLLRPFWSADFGKGAAGSMAPPDWPAVGLTREHQLRSQRAAEAARRTADAQRRLQLLWSDALREAAVAFAARQPPVPSATADAQYLRGLHDSWIDCAEEAYARTAHGDAFCAALAEFVNASSAWRAEAQASVEYLAKALDLPTRSEINTLARRLKSLEEQLAERRQRKPRPAARKAGTRARAKSARRAPRRPKS